MNTQKTKYQTYFQLFSIIGIAMLATLSSWHWIIAFGVACSLVMVVWDRLADKNKS